MSFVDFETVKKAVSFEQAITVLGLAMKKTGNQWRGICPACKAGGPRSLVVTEGRGYYCFAASAGGDQIALVAHIQGCKVKEAAEFLAGKVLVHSPKNSTSQTVPESESGSETKKFAPLAYLEVDHPAMEAVGFDSDFARKVGIGYAPKGILRGTVAVPIRDDLGNLLGYIGITEATLPSSFQPATATNKKSA